MKITNIDQKGIYLITSSEGFESKPYLCPANVPTIGFGTTRYPSGSKVTLNDREITRDEAISFLKYDVRKFELNVDEYCVDSITQNQFNALVSFVYNLGAQNLKSSTLLKKVNLNPNDPAIKEEFEKWVYAGKEKLPGLIIRREKEYKLYFTK